MDISSLLKIDYIACYDSLRDQSQVFESIVDIAIQSGSKLDKSTIVAKFQAREEQGTTGLLDGFAIPHAQDSSITEAKIIILSSQTSILWETLDDQEVRFVFGLLIPSANKNDLHLDILAKIASLLMNEDFRNEIKNTSNRNEIFEVLLKYSEGSL
ncbi:MAG: PTS sugar transporter subunit IIA [Brevinema sp.]